DEVLPPIAAQAADRMIDEVLRTREAKHGVVVTATAVDGVERRVIASCIPLVLPGGELIGLAAALLDDTERHRGDERRAELLQRLTLLVDASAVLDESLDADRLMCELAELLVERFADGCEAVLAGADESHHVAAGDVGAKAAPSPDHVVVAPITARGRDL